VLGDTKTKAAILRKIFLTQLILFHLQALLKNLLGLLTTNCHVTSNLFVSSDTEASDGETSAREDWLLLSELFQHLASTGETVTTFTHADVEHQLLHANLAHGIVGLVRHVGGCKS